MSGAYYNEHDAYAAQWLRNLIAAGHIAPGDVDERSIEDVLPRDLDGYTQCHFFAGIGVWSYALRRAGWADDRPVWTGSCPCQPFSAAGKGAAFDDERHLWPAFHHLIKERRPAVVFGEQVASKDADEWIDLVQADLEGVGYAFGCVPFPAAGVGAFHLRDRNYWMAHPESESERGCGGRSMESWSDKKLGRSGAVVRMGDAQGERCGEARELSARPKERIANAGTDGRMADADDTGLEGRDGMHQRSIECATGPSGVVEWIDCRDGKRRPIEPGAFPLAYGDTFRVGRLRAYGNAIHAEAAEAFIRSACEVME